MEKLKETEFIPVGRKIKVGFKTFKAVETKEFFSCEKCCFNLTEQCSFFRNHILGECTADNRPDRKEVYFVECK